jgi:hypothetical protein
VPPCDCSQPAFFVGRAGKFNNDGTLTGIVAANTPLGSVKLGKNVFMPDGTSIQGNYVEIGNASNVSQVFANTVKTGLGAVIRNGSGPVTLPIADPFCQIPSFTCGANALFVAPGDTAFATPGTYGFVRVPNGATLHLAGGVYTVCDVKMGREASIIADGPVLLQITGNLRIGTDSFFGPAIGSPPIAVYVAGRKVRISQSAVAEAQITAPFAKISFGRDATLTGCFCSDLAKSDKHITLTCPTP